jgi:hypothetical protein
MPGHQLVDAVLRPAVDKACQQVGEVDLWVDVIQFARLDQRIGRRRSVSTFVRVVFIM